MIRPTMSHAVNKEELHKLMSDYADYLEGRKSHYSNRAIIAETRLREEEQENAKLREEVKNLKQGMIIMEENCDSAQQRAEKAEAERGRVKTGYINGVGFVSQELEDYVNPKGQVFRLTKADLSKRDIEQQIKALEGFRAEFDAQNDHYGDAPMAYIGDLDSHIKQLRKELEK